MNNKFEDIYKILKKDKRVVSEDGNLLKNKLYTLAMNMDEALLEILVSHDITKDLFFKKVDDILVFDKVKFSWLIDSKDFLPDSYTAFKNKIMLTDDKGNSIKNSSDVVLSFPFKDCVLEADSTKEKEDRNEVFLNEVLMKKEIDTLLTPKVFTNAKRYNINGVENIDNLKDDDNLIIKGNNLLALHSLLPRYKGKIKCMYWDILYNTNNDKVPYNDSFKHSSWLTMIKNRLEIAKELLKDDGVICLQCDDNEMAYLKVLCDEIFDRESLVNTLVVEMASTGGVKRTHKNSKFLKTKEYILIYSRAQKNEIKCQYNVQTVLDSHFSIYFDGKKYSTLKKEIENAFPNKKIAQNYWLLDKDIKKYILDNAKNIFQYHPAPKWTTEDGHTKSILYDDGNTEIVSFTHKDNPENIEILKSVKNKEKYGRLEPLEWNVEVVSGEREICTLRGDLWSGFHKDMGNVKKERNANLINGKKPERLINDLIDAFTKPGDIVLDAYLGSGTTASVCHKRGLQYIGIEQLDKHFQIAIDSLIEVINGDKTGVSKTQNWKGGGSFVSCELKVLSQELIDNVLNSTKEELGNIYDKLKNNSFVTYRVDINKLEENQEGFNSLTEDEKRKFLIEVIDKNLLYVNYSEIDDENYNVSEEDKLFNHSFYKREI